MITCPITHSWIYKTLSDKMFPSFSSLYWRKQNNPIKCFLSALIVAQQHSSQAIPFSPNSVISYYQLLYSCHCCWLAFVQKSHCQFTVLPCISQGKSPYKEKILKLVIQACPRSSQKLAYLQKMTATMNLLPTCGNLQELREVNSGLQKSGNKNKNKN